MSGANHDASSGAKIGACPNCGGGPLREFYRVDDIPVSSCVLVDSRDEALSFPRRDLRLSSCGACGFITNTAFDAAAQSFSDRYEETQGFSPTFSAFARQLASRLGRALRAARQARA